MADEDLEWSDELLRSFRRSAFRFETRSTYALGYEQADFDRFLAGSPVPPTELDWWRPWLEEISRMTAGGKTVSRVRVLDDPPSDYQRWEMWAAPWHSRAGERIAYVSRSEAMRAMLPLWLGGDWWLLDDERVICMHFTEDGAIEARTTSSDPGTVARFIEWRDLAVRIATPAEEHAAA
jgi:hypothetical protein